MADFPLWKYGKGKTTLVLVHGGPSLSRYMGTLGKLLQDKYSIVEYQQRGTPEFPAEAPALTELLSDLKTVLDSCPPDRVLIGHSWGATLVNLYLRQYQEKAVFLSPAPLALPEANAFSKNLKSRFPEDVKSKVDSLQKLEENSEPDLVQELEQKRLELISPYYHAKPETDAYLKGQKWNYHSFCAIFDQVWDLIDKGELGPMNGVPVIHGEHDPIPAPSGATLVREAGHFPWLENPKAFISELELILKKLSV